MGAYQEATEDEPCHTNVAVGELDLESAEKDVKDASVMLCVLLIIYVRNSLNRSFSRGYGQLGGPTSH